MPDLIFDETQKPAGEVISDTVGNNRAVLIRHHDQWMIIIEDFDCTTIAERITDDSALAIVFYSQALDYLYSKSLRGMTAV